VNGSTLELSAEQIRVLGCLLEKQRTTPDVYPLSLNSLRLACNQSTNREPVVEYDEATVRDALHRLERHGLVRLASGAGSRATKYRHLLAERLPMDRPEEAVMCVLMLRGPQTPGELKQRGERMHPFADLDEVQATLSGLIERGLAERLHRRPGQKEERYRELLGAEEEGEKDAQAGERDRERDREEEKERPGVAEEPALRVPAAAEPGGANGDGALAERVARLECEVAKLRARLEAPSAEPMGQPPRSVPAGWSGGQG
jgi:uncharacterized protein YceH (UPF0502 family)